MTPVVGMPIGALCAEAVANLRGHAKRSILALLGIIIGSASIIALLNLGHIAQLETLKRFQQMGADMLEVRAVPTGNAPAKLDRALINDLPKGNTDILEAVSLAIGRSQVLSGAKDADAMIAAVSPHLFDVAGLSVAYGRSIRPVDRCNLVAVVGAGIAESLSVQSQPLKPGQLLHIGNYGYTIIGILPPVPFEALSPVNYDAAVFIPLSCAQRVLQGPDPNIALIRLRAGAAVGPAGQQVTERLSNPTSSLRVRSARSLIQAMNEQKAAHTRMLSAIGGISLVVGGIGILNVMLMTVMERRREIGLRAALGATPRDIRLMFLLEAVILSISGGLIGGLLGVSATVLIATVSGWSFAVALWILPLGPGMAALVGIIFGLYPAWAASQVDPIEALHAY